MKGMVNIEYYEKGKDGNLYLLDNESIATLVCKYIIEHKDEINNYICSDDNYTYRINVDYKYIDNINKNNFNVIKTWCYQDKAYAKIQYNNNIIYVKLTYDNKDKEILTFVEYVKDEGFVDIKSIYIKDIETNQEDFMLIYKKLCEKLEDLLDNIQNTYDSEWD